MIDDSMSPNFMIYHIFGVILGHIPFRARFTDLHGVACLSPLARYTPKWLTGSLFYDDPLVEPLWSRSARPTFLGIWLLSCFLFRETFPRCLDLIWIMEITCSMIDDSMSPDFLIYHIFDVILEHISISDEVYQSSWSYMIISTYEVCAETMTCSLSYHDLSAEPLWSHSARPTFLGIWLSPSLLFRRRFIDVWVWFGSWRSHIWWWMISCHPIFDLSYI